MYRAQSWDADEDRDTHTTRQGESTHIPDPYRPRPFDPRQNDVPSHRPAGPPAPGRKELSDILIDPDPR